MTLRIDACSLVYDNHAVGDCGKCLLPAIDTPVSAGDGKATEHATPIFTAGKRNHISPEIALEVQAQKGQVGRVDHVIEMLVQGKKSATTGTVSQSAPIWTALL